MYLKKSITFNFFLQPSGRVFITSLTEQLEYNCLLKYVFKFNIFIVNDLISEYE